MRDGIAVYPGTFDPFTRGHEDLVRRASRLFEGVIVGVAASAGKGPIFSVQARVEIGKEVLAPYPNVEVQGFSCLLMDFLHQNDARVILRGLRAVSDFGYEFQMAGMNRRLYPDGVTVFLTPADEYMGDRVGEQTQRRTGRTGRSSSDFFNGLPGLRCVNGSAFSSIAAKLSLPSTGCIESIH